MAEKCVMLLCILVYSSGRHGSWGSVYITLISHNYFKQETRRKVTKLYMHLYNNKNKLHGLSPRANYTDRATAACRRTDCQLLRIKGATWSA
jgi:hypothetical protein